MLEIREVQTSSNREVNELINRSTLAFQIVDKPKIVATFGVTSNSLVGMTCGVWAQTNVTNNRVAIGRLTVRLRDWLLNLFPEIVTLVACNDEIALRWISWLGFEDAGEEPDRPGARRMILRRT